MEDHRGEGNDGGIHMISDDRLKHPIDKLRTTQILPPIQLRIQDGGRAHQDGVDHDEAEEEEEGPKLEHDKHERHCMAGSAATSNLGSEGRGGKRPKILVVCSPQAPSPPHPVGGGGSAGGGWQRICRRREETRRWTR
ncbi:hypothetical protein OsJ_07407 [Oryza sativa Japonica Group]|uniref:Uncharacterized protein n=1 Tax=Oryza sativa subsp. japonica TaxID=39947 RepID=B9F0X4_ORYSJ|nr:hypothetical protein OsJ_07407 [Oryza sativa Japonica Group]